MYRLYLMRHAKAAWGGPAVSDFGRPLAPTGKEDAKLLGQNMKKRSYLPDIIICSGARRTRETWDAVASFIAAEARQVHFLDELYRADSAECLALVMAYAGRSSLMVVGHNPVMEDLALALAPTGDGRALAAVRAGFPAAGLAVLEFETPLGEAGPGKGVLVDFLRPAR